MSARRILASIAAAATLLLAPENALAAGGGAKSAKDVDFSFEGPFGRFDQGQLQRGFKVYMEVCSSCHSARLVSWRHLGQAGAPFFDPNHPNPNDNPVIKALAAETLVVDGPDDVGDMFERPGIPSDPLPSPFANDAAARAANGGALPPDLSLIAKAREGFHGGATQFWKGAGGAEYVYSLLSEYQDPPQDAEQASEGLYYNPYFAQGEWIAMAPPLSDGIVDYDDGTKASVEQMSLDVAAFLAWSAEPKMEERKRIGMQTMAYLLVLAALLGIGKKRVWASLKVKPEEDASA